MAEEHALLQEGIQEALPRPSDTTKAIGEEDTDQTGGPHWNSIPATEYSKNLSTKDLFNPGLFLANESVMNTENRLSYGTLVSPPRIGIPPFRRGYWLDKSSEDPCDWSQILGDPKDSESAAQKCVELEPIPFLVAPIRSAVERAPSSPIKQRRTGNLAKGAGLQNAGTTCFMNAVLQCFLHIVPLVDGILSDLQPCLAIKFCPLCAFRNLIRQSFTAKFKAFTPLELIKNLSEISSSFKRNQQQDAHEFLQCFLNGVENCYGPRGGHRQSENVVAEVFRGGVISKLKCLSCGYLSDTLESSLDLSLEIENADNLITAMQSFTKLEKIDDPDNNVQCKGCLERAPAEKQLNFTKVPRVATFHLKRFKSDGFVIQKVGKHVAFPLELDLLPFVLSTERTDEKLKYMLYAVVVHQGALFSCGHYYSFIRLAANTWYMFNDENVYPVAERRVLAQAAYILFYVKEGTPWFSSFVDKLPNLLTTTESDMVKNGEECDVEMLSECSIESNLPSCKRPLEILTEDTEAIKQELIASFLAATGIDDDESRKKSRKDDST